MLLHIKRKVIINVEPCLENLDILNSRCPVYKVHVSYYASLSSMFALFKIKHEVAMVKLVKHLDAHKKSLNRSASLLSAFSDNW